MSALGKAGGDALSRWIRFSVPTAATNCLSLYQERPRVRAREVPLQDALSAQADNLRRVGRVIVDLQSPGDHARISIFQVDDQFGRILQSP